MDLPAGLKSEIIEWDIGAWSKALEFWGRDSAGLVSGSNALEVGARNGGLSLYLALCGCNVVCSDLDLPGEAARALHRKHGVEKRVRYAAVDATNIAFPDESFDIVVFKSVLGGLAGGGGAGRQQQAVSEMRRVLKPGGRLLFAENLRGSFLHMYARKTFISWGKGWRYIAAAEVKVFLSEFSEVKLATYGFFGAFGRSEVQRRFLGRIDAVVNPFISSRARYIVYGIAVK